jgi:phenylalanyl-tRNA synthetase beta chain
LEIAQPLAAREIRYVPLRRYPTSGFDLSLVAPLRQPVAEIQRQLTKLAAEDLVSIDFVRQYVGPPLPQGTKSVTYRLEVGAADRTLTLDDVGIIRGRVIEGMQALGHEIRGL